MQISFVKKKKKKIQSQKSNLDLNPCSITFTYSIALSDPPLHHL